MCLCVCFQECHRGVMAGDHVVLSWGTEVWDWRGCTSVWPRGRLWFRLCLLLLCLIHLLQLLFGMTRSVTDSSTLRQQFLKVDGGVKCRDLSATLTYFLLIFCLDAEPVCCCYHGQFWVSDQRLIHLGAAPLGWICPDLGGVWSCRLVSVSLSLSNIRRLQFWSHCWSYVTDMLSLLTILDEKNYFKSLRTVLFCKSCWNYEWFWR